MAYQVNKYNGSFLVSVADGTIDNTTDLRFVGKNYSGYGQIQNENFLHLLENFSGVAQPTKAVTGQLWFDTNENKIKVYDGSSFKIVGAANASSVAPTGLTSGEFWFDTASQQLYCWNGSEYTLIGPENSSLLGETSVSTALVRDENNQVKTIAKLQSGDSVIAIISKDQFTLSTSITGNSIAGFENGIFKGITLANTDTDGLTSRLSGYLFRGTASSAEKLIDSTTNDLYAAEDFIKTSTPTFSTRASFRDGLKITSGSGESIQDRFVISLDGINIRFNESFGESFKFSILGNDVINFNADSVTPGSDSNFDLGSSDAKWNQIFADFFVGNLTGDLTGNVISPLDGSIVVNANTRVFTGSFNGSLTGNVTGNVTGNLNGNATSATNASSLDGSVASTLAAAGTIAARDASGNITANRFIGLADFSSRMPINDAAIDGPTYKSAKTTPVADTIAARDASGNISAVIFNGQATSVVGADLAEKYLADKEYEIGTVVKIGGEKEITACTEFSRAIGVVSGNPAYMMNKDLEGGTYIALKGRVPVKIGGPISKGDMLMAGKNGYAVACPESLMHLAFAVSLESKNDDNIRTAECLVL